MGRGPVHEVNSDDKFVGRIALMILLAVAIALLVASGALHLPGA